ncbi:MAG: 6-carboxytetrahydropterin synthase [Bacteroidales bacterium]|nr:6-carboxytetrahydropterin synthase [Bacteroidales bacterium]
MAIIRITKKFEFEMAHALAGYDGLCRNIHGHSYKLFVTIKGEPEADKKSPKDGMVFDFSALKNLIQKEIVEKFDHALVLNEKANQDDVFKTSEMFSNIILVDFQPTCENLLTDFAFRIKQLIPKNISLHSLKLCETSTSFAEWFEEDNLK